MGRTLHINVHINHGLFGWRRRRLAIQQRAMWAVWRRGIGRRLALVVWLPIRWDEKRTGLGVLRSKITMRPHVYDRRKGAIVIRFRDLRST